MDLTDLENKHAPADDPFWQESWYFNFSDAKKNVFGLTRIGYRPSGEKADGLLLASLIFNLPFAVQPMQRAFASIPRELREAAWVSGLSRWQTFLRIELPLAWPGIALERDIGDRPVLVSGEPPLLRYERAPRLARHGRVVGDLPCWLVWLAL